MRALDRRDEELYEKWLRLSSGEQFAYASLMGMVNASVEMTTGEFLVEHDVVVRSVSNVLLREVVNGVTIRYSPYVAWAIGTSIHRRKQMIAHVGFVSDPFDFGRVEISVLIRESYIDLPLFNASTNPYRRFSFNIGEANNAALHRAFFRIFDELRSVIIIQSECGRSYQGTFLSRKMLSSDIFFFGVDEEKWNEIEDEDDEEDNLQIIIPLDRFDDVIMNEFVPSWICDYVTAEVERSVWRGVLHDLWSVFARHERSIWNVIGKEKIGYMHSQVIDDAFVDEHAFDVLYKVLLMIFELWPLHKTLCLRMNSLFPYLRLSVLEVFAEHVKPGFFSPQGGVGDGFVESTRVIRRKSLLIRMDLMSSHFTDDRNKPRFVSDVLLLTDKFSRRITPIEAYTLRTTRFAYDGLCNMMYGAFYLIVEDRIFRAAKHDINELKEWIVLAFK